VASGWGGSYALVTGGVLPTGSRAKVGRLMVFKLGANGALPTLPAVDDSRTALPEPLNVSADVIAAGAKVYVNRCSLCHGDQAYSSGLIPNLRYSAITKSAIAWDQIVRGGALQQKGMPKFSEVIDQATSESIRAYVISEANSERDKKFYQSLSK